jgi:hypothetical protein
VKKEQHQKVKKGQPQKLELKVQKVQHQQKNQLELQLNQ